VVIAGDVEALGAIEDRVRWHEATIAGLAGFVLALAAAMLC
jgi:hypothetical protein